MSGLSRRAAAVLMVATFSGCAGSQRDLDGSPVVPQSPSMSRAATHEPGPGPRGDLLYTITNDGIEVLTYPKGRKVFTIKITGPWALCSDASGDVFVPTYDRYVYEYAHGGKHPIARLDTQTDSPLTGCSVDPATGNVAVAAFHDGIIIFSNGSKYEQIEPPIVPYKCAYDDQGNLFVNGISYFALAELAKGSGQFNEITLDREGNRPDGDLQWDGQYMAVSTTQAGPAIYRFTVSGSQGTVVQTVRARGQKGSGMFIVVDKRVIGQRNHSPIVGVWEYPRGNRLHRGIDAQAQDLALSVSP
jgi:hypothetical protein